MPGTNTLAYFRRRNNGEKSFITLTVEAENDETSRKPFSPTEEGKVIKQVRQSYRQNGTRHNGICIMMTPGKTLLREMTPE